MESSVEPSKADSLRGFVTERLAAASMEILAAVERAVAAYEEEASGLRLEIHRQRIQLELLQNRVTAGTQDVPSSRRHAEEEEDDDSPSSPSPSSQSDGRNPGRPRISAAQGTIDLSVRLLEGSRISFLSRNVVKKSPLVSLQCPRGLQQRDFLSLLRSTVPQLTGDDKTFDILTSDKRRRLQVLNLKTVTPEEIVRNARSTGLRKTTLYIRMKTQKEAQGEISLLQAENSSAIIVSEETKQADTSSTSQHPHMETENDGLMISASGEDSLAPPAAEWGEHVGNSEETKGSDSSLKLDAGDEEREWGESITEREDQPAEARTETENGSAGSSRQVCRAAQDSDVAGSVCGESGEASNDHFHGEDRTDGRPHCAETLLSVLGLNEPLKAHAGEANHSSPRFPLENSQKPQEPRHKCPTCQKVFELETQLEAHRRTHRKCKTYLCGVCGKFLSSNRSLSRHKMTHSGERPHRCRICERGFKLATTLKQHEKIHTDRERPYLCDVCCKMFLTSKQLLIHMRTHTNEKPYRCDRCGKGFTTRGPLTIHMRVHTGETPYRCPHCGWSFKRKTHLDDHVAIHTGAKPYVCGICGKTCARRTYLTVHMRTHNGERPYKCSLCEKAFTQSHCLKTHMKSHKAGKNVS